jgi:hypothetical protein
MILTVGEDCVNFTAGILSSFGKQHTAIGEISKLHVITNYRIGAFSQTFLSCLLPSVKYFIA